MRVRVCFHDNCFDGAASAALFTRFYRERIDAAATLLYRGMTHQPGVVFPEGTFDGDENVVLDFRYSSDPRLSWWFDHHVSAFLSPDEETHFRQGPQDHKFYDPAARSCARFLANVCDQRFGFDITPHAELIEWAEIVDGALFPTPESAVRLAEPALQIMTWIENNRDAPLTERLIERLVDAQPLAAIAAEPWVKGALEPVLRRHAASLDLLRARVVHQRGVVTFDVADDELTTYNKFIPYYLHPDCRFVVGVSLGSGRAKVSVGSNPWRPRPKLSIAAICERYGGGGHPVVGAVSLHGSELSRAREIAGEIAEELRRFPDE